MNRAAIQVFVGFVLLVTLAAGLLVRVRANFTLGKPGVRVVNAPLYNEENLLIADKSVYLPERVGEPFLRCEEVDAPTMWSVLVYLDPGLTAAVSTAASSSRSRPVLGRQRLTPTSPRHARQMCDSIS